MESHTIGRNVQPSQEVILGKGSKVALLGLFMDNSFYVNETTEMQIASIHN